MLRTLILSALITLAPACMSGQSTISRARKTVTKAAPVKKSTPTRYRRTTTTSSRRPAASTNTDEVSSREYIRRTISKWGSCRNVAITSYGGDIALNQGNAYAYKNIPSDLAESIDELHDKGEYIDDIQLTEEERYLILYGNNGMIYKGLPDELEEKMKEYNENNEVVTSITFNDEGDWIIVSTEHICASSTDIQDFIKEKMDEYGGLLAAHLTDDGLVLCYEGGYRFLGNVPENLKQALRESSYDVYRIKFTSQGSYFFADKKGRYQYNM